MRDGGGTGDNLPRGVVGIQRPAKRHQVEARMVVILFVFRSECGPDQVWRDTVEWHVSALAGIRVNDFVQNIAVPVKNSRGFKLRSSRTQRVDVRKSARDFDVLVNPERADCCLLYTSPS